MALKLYEIGGYTYQYEEGTEPEGAKALSRTGRPTKAELLEELGEVATNPEIADAIEEAKKSPAKGRRPANKARNTKNKGA